jgi:LmbE family N-acetylglucosaminyl deacetylase
MSSVEPSRRKVLVVAAHPDDEVLGVGGTIAWHSRIRGDEVHVLILTEGCSSQYRQARNTRSIIARKKREARAANLILGVADVLFADLPDMRLDGVEHVELNAVIENAIARVRPDTLYTHFPDVNKDHSLIFESTMVAVRPVPGTCVRRVLAFAPASSTEWSAPFPGRHFTPNVYVDITGTLEIKLKALRCYGTELRQFPHPRSLEAVSVYAQQAGVTVGLAAAEPFALIRALEG